MSSVPAPCIGQHAHLERRPAVLHWPQDISRFLRNPFKPAVLAMSRPDAKKNITTLVKAFGEHTMLRELANLVLVMVRRVVLHTAAHALPQ